MQIPVSTRIHGYFSVPSRGVHSYLQRARRKGAGVLAALLLFAAAGCGGTGLLAGAGSNELVLHAAKDTLDTNSTDLLTAALPSGAPARVTWSIVGGQNAPSIGQGSISSGGRYTPPPFLSQDTVTVEIRAALENNPAKAVTYPLTVTPGFVQQLTPENASLAPGGTVRMMGEIAEINAGSVRWSVGPTASGETTLGAQYGSISEVSCRHSAQSYTSCTALYTAPRVLPPQSSSLYAVGSVANNSQSVASLHLLLNAGGFNSSALENQSAQTAASVELGASGGNANDYDSSQDSHGTQYVNDCCGGTLGSLVQDHNNNLYILSNNHVLAESDQARLGDTIIEPALIDLNCDPQAGRTVGSLRFTVPLESTETNVDAALAAATPAVDPSGAILQLGEPVNGALTAAAPAAGTGEPLTANQLSRLRVVKSGRTTGLTCSTVNTIDLSVQVDYFYDCAESRPFYTKLYTNQIGIPGASFADSGDSGALVLDSGNAQPIGLLFASGIDNANHGLSVANPIQDVLSELSQKSQAGGQSFQIVGGAPHPITCSQYDRGGTAVRRLSADQAAVAGFAADTAAATLMRPDNGILGVGTAASLDAPEEPAVVVYVDRNKPNVTIPKMIGGLRTLVIRTDETSANAGILPASAPDTEGIHLPAEVLRSAALVERQYAPMLMNDLAIFGVGVTQSYDNSAEAALLVLVDVKRTPESMPNIVGGLRVRYMRLNRLHVTASKWPGSHRPTSCQLRATRR